MVYRIYVEKKEGLANDAAALRNEVKTLLGIDRVTDARVINRYDVENIDEALFADCRWKVFAEPQLDNTADSLEERSMKNTKPWDATRLLTEKTWQRQ